MSYIRELQENQVGAKMWRLLMPGWQVWASAEGDDHFRTCHVLRIFGRNNEEILLWCYCWQWEQELTEWLWGILSGWWECSKTGLWWWLHNLVNLLKPLIYTLICWKWVNFICKLYLNEGIKNAVNGRRYYSDH